jgi:hypothetical protein
VAVSEDSPGNINSDVPVNEKKEPKGFSLMSSNMLTLAVFFSALLSVSLCLFLNIGILKCKLKRWDSNSTIYFVMSLSNAISVNEHKKEWWRNVLGYDEDESTTILRHQTMCLLETLVGFVVSGWLLARFFALKP